MGTKTNLALPTYNSLDWNTPLNSNFSIVNDALGSTEAVSVAAADVTLTTAQAQKMRILISGTLTANRIVSIPNGTTGFWIVTNATAGNYTVTIKNSGGAASVSTDVGQGTSALLCSDGTNVFPANNSPTTGTVPAGTIITYGGLTPPVGYLWCDGTAYSRTTYSLLFTAIGTTWGAGNGSSTFNVPNLQGAFLRGSGAGLNPSSRSVGSYEADKFGSHSHVASVSDPGHAHSYTAPASSPLAAGSSGSAFTQAATTGSSTTGITVSISASGSNETAPKNYGVLYCIKY